MTHILVTGGAGYIGSHTVVELIGAGYDVSVIDNLSNSSREVIRRVERIAGSSIPLHVFDLQDKTQLEKLFQENQFDAVIHFAGLKAVGESVFSSSATVYGSAPIPYKETSSVGQGITNPYGQTKYMIEQILHDTAAANPEDRFIALRYFNPIGAHTSGLIGEHPNGTPNNLMPYITQVATGKREKLSIFGNDYETVDGTGVRDYIHVVDLAKGHVAALRHIKPGFDAINLGSGKGTSVLELVHAFEKASGKEIPYEIIGRRPGDLPEYYADAAKAFELLEWKTEKTIEDACADSWRWQSNNPNGYET